MGSSQRDLDRRTLLATALGTPAVLAAVGWYLWPSKIDLSNHTYDIAIALYRVCNQQDDEGLQKIQGKLDELQRTGSVEDPAVVHLQQIVDLAETGNWTTAMRETRTVLEDQVSGV